MILKVKCEGKSDPDLDTGDSDLVEPVTSDLKLGDLHAGQVRKNSCHCSI